MKQLLFLIVFFIPAFYGQAQKANDVNAPLHALKPDYPVPYGAPAISDVEKTIDRIYQYLNAVTPAKFIEKNSGKEISNYSQIDTNTIFQPGDFRLTSYEWGVTYSGMLEAGAATGNPKYTEYTKSRLSFLAEAAPAFQQLLEKTKYRNSPMRQVIDQHALDDAGAVCAAMIKALSDGGQSNLRPLIDRYINYITKKEYRLSDGTLARNRPQKNTLWLDDLYMSVPAIAQMGKLTGNAVYYDEGVKQVALFSKRMFNKEKGLYMHGWVEGMKEHPQFHWARANGWAFMAMTELLDVLPENHKGRTALLEQYRSLAKGLTRYQTGTGFWHQLIDRNDSYLETSATAIYTYCLARGINKGWLDGAAYAPAAILAWNAVSTRVNDKGQVEGTCVGTGMAFDPAFYYYRPVNVYAAHGYGPVLLAGAEIIRLLKQHQFEINDSSLQLKSN